jgi:hypothetical protein
LYKAPFLGRFACFTILQTLALSYSMPGCPSRGSRVPQWLLSTSCTGGKALNWIDSYYEALEFFYFEPQHMRRQQLNPEDQKALQRAEKSENFDVVKKHLREMEVTLNHNINQFFHLAPDSFRCKLFETVFGAPFEGMFRLLGREVEGYFGPENVMQPDFLFVSEASAVSIEMKVKSKSSIDQLQKYALLGLVLEKQEHRKKQHYLLLLGRGNLTQQFKDRFETVGDLKKQALAEIVVSDFLSKKRKWQSDKERFCEILRGMKIAFWNYADFSNFLQAARPSELDTSLGAEVCRKLFDGLREEFALRKLG